MAWPLFQSALSSAPFPGTLADTTVPTLDQTPPPMLPDFPTRGDLTPSPDPEIAAQAKRLRSSAMEYLDLADQVAAHQPDYGNNWVDHLRMALNPNYKEARYMAETKMKAGAISDLVGRAADLMQQERLLTAPTPGEAERQRLQERAIQRYQDMVARLQIIQAAEKELGQPIDPRLKAQFLETGQDIAKGVSGNPLEDVGKAADIGAKGVVVPGPFQGVMGQAKSFAEGKTVAGKRTEADDLTRKLTGFKDANEFFDNLQQSANRIRSEVDHYEFQDLGATDPLTQLPVKTKVPIYKYTWEQARQKAAAEFPGTYQIFPNYATGGAATFDQLPKAVPAAAQGDVTPPKRTPQEALKVLQNLKPK